MILISIFSEDKQHLVKRFVFSGTSTAEALQTFVEANIHHRQGKIHANILTYIHKIHTQLFIGTMQTNFINVHALAFIYAICRPAVICSPISLTILLCRAT